LVPVLRFSGEVRQVLFDTPRRRPLPVARLVVAKARGRSAGESPCNVPAACLKRAKPKGAASGRRTNPVAVARDSRKGESPETAARWAGPAQQRREKPTGKTVCGFIRAETRRIPSVRRKLRRANPKSAAGMK